MMPAPAPDNLRRAALDLHDAFGWFVLPVDPVTKRPRLAWKQIYGDRLPTREEIAGWPHWDHAGVGLGVRTGAISGIVVLDVDSEEAHRFLKEHRHQAGPMVQSPREDGGFHVYFKHPGYFVKSTVGLAGVEGLDVRAEGGIVVLPPSFNPRAGRAYEWIISPYEGEAPDLPAWLADTFARERRFKGPVDGGKIMAGVPKGQRDDELNRLAGYMRHKNFPEDVAIDIIEKAAERCIPPFGKAEARMKVKQAWAYYEPGEDIPPTLLLDGEAEPSPNGVVSLGALEEPGPRTWLVEGLIPMKYPTTLYGSGGVAKSMLMLSLATAIAAGEGEWLGFKVQSGPVLYLDFELEVEEQTRRGYEVARGLGLERPPADLFYQCAAGGKIVDAFRAALAFCKERGVKLLVVDSTGLALGGDAESSKDVIAFFREVVGTFTGEGVCMLLIDHQAKIQSGESYQKKSAFGSAYKEYLARSALQIELARPGEGEITVRFRQKKTNFGAAVDPFEVRVRFAHGKVDIEKLELDDGELASEETLGAQERVLRALRHLGEGAPPDVAELSGQPLSTVRKQFSLLKKQGQIIETGAMRDGAKVCMPALTPELILGPAESAVNRENAEKEILG